MDATFNEYHVDPRTTRGDLTGRFPLNFVTFPFFLKPLVWGDAVSRLVRRKPAYGLGDSLLKLFDSVSAPADQWGSAAEIAILRSNIVQLSSDLDANPYISPVGRVLAKTMLKGHLRNRVDTIAFYGANRSFIEAHGRFKAPLIITGFPRTGTTLLQRLISEDPATRSPYAFELEKSTPPLRRGVDPMRDSRIARSAASLAAIKKMMPGFLEKFAESHLLSPTEREESMIYMQAHNGVAMLIAPTVGSAYFRSMNQPEIADALFRYERNFFTMLDAFCPAPSHWTLKAPNYAPYFSRLFIHYPDARVVVTHRHPSKNMASVCRMIETWQLPFARNGSFDKVRFGDIMQSEMRAFLSGPLAYRQANPQHEPQIVDCLYQDFIRDPIAMVRKIYRRFDLDYTTDFDRRMRVYLTENKQGKHGRHKYNNHEYGIDTAILYAQNMAYYKHYGFEKDAGASD